MAKVKNTAAPAAKATAVTNKDGSARKSTSGGADRAKPMSEADLKKSAKGVIKLIQASAFNLGKQNKFEGTELKSLDQKAAENKIKPKFVPKSGSFFKLSEEGDEFKKIKTLAKASAVEMEKGTYGSATKAFLNGLVNMAGERGQRTFNQEKVKGLAGLL